MSQTYKGKFNGKSEKKDYARKGIKCPICGAAALLRPATEIFASADDPNARLWVCSNWPGCNTYVIANPHTLEPNGTLANKQLRVLRSQAHEYFDLLHMAGIMSRIDAYKWMAEISGLNENELHIRYLGEYGCRTVISQSKEILKRHLISDKIDCLAVIAFRRTQFLTDKRNPPENWQPSDRPEELTRYPDPEVRERRLQALAHLEVMRTQNILNERAVYYWVGSLIDLPPARARIDICSIEDCDVIVAACRRFLDTWPATKELAIDTMVKALVEQYHILGREEARKNAEKLRQSRPGAYVFGR